MFYVAVLRYNFLGIIARKLSCKAIHWLASWHQTADEAHHERPLGRHGVPHLAMRLAERKMRPQCQR